MAIDSVEATQGLQGGGSVGDVSVGLEPPVSRQNGGTGVSVVTNTQLVNALGVLPTSGGTMSGNLTVTGNIIAGTPSGTAPTGPGAINAQAIYINGDPVGTGGGLPATGGTLTGPLSINTGTNTAPLVLKNNSGIATFINFDNTPAGGSGPWSVGVGPGGGFQITDATATPTQRLTINPTTGSDPGTVNVVGNFDVGQSALIESGLVVGAPVDANLGVGTVNVQNLIRVNPTGAALGTAPPGTRLVLESDDTTRILLSSHVNSPVGGGAVISFRSSLGTAVAPQAAPADFDFGIIGFNAFGTTTYGPRSAGIKATSLEAFTDSAHGTELNFEATPAGPGAGGVIVAMKVRAEGIWIPGDVYAGGASFPSDRRLKQNIEPWECGLDEVQRLHPISFEYNGRGGTRADGRIRVGLDADDASEVIPEMVGTRSFADLDGTPIKTVSPDMLTFTLLNAVKELATRLEALERSK